MLLVLRLVMGVTPPAAAAAEFADLAAFAKVAAVANDAGGGDGCGCRCN